MKNLYDLKREFLEHCELEKNQSLLTVENYGRYLDRFLKYLEEYKSKMDNGQEDNRQQTVSSEQEPVSRPSSSSQLFVSVLFPSDIDQEVARQYRLHINRLKDMYGRELKASTQNYHMLALRAFLRFLAFRGEVSLSPEKVSVGKNGDREITFLEGDEVGQILEKPDIGELSGLRDKAILHLFFSTGLRVSELVSLNVSDINFERGEIAVLGKGKKIRVVFISKEALYWLDQYLKNRGYSSPSPGSLSGAEDEPLFLSIREGRLTVRSIERIVKKYAIRAGLTKHVSPHTLRHSFATDLLISGADIRSVQSMLGHSSITTTQVYTHVTDHHLREIHDKYHGKRINSTKYQVPSTKNSGDDDTKHSVLGTEMEQSDSINHQVLKENGDPN
ncbi:MAG TPA: tyrosine-type recombinase/integrase [bacterium]|nr:tyrosine-type recombinase/integrase [bacterium]